jgi:ribosomal protein S18 acetylase RimI-like enzyme
VYTWAAVLIPMNTAVIIRDYQPADRPAIRTMLSKIGWAEQYIAAAERNAESFSQQPERYGIYTAEHKIGAVGFLFVQWHQWNNLAQIDFLAVDPSTRRQGVAAALVTRAEQFAVERGARGIYVDTPVNNHGGRAFYEAVGYQFGYLMPRYYESQLDGVTYQKFFDTTSPK